MALSAGSIAFTGYNGDGNDNLSFVALTDIPQGTVINFTDSNWNGTNFASGSNSESTVAWTATSAIPAGTVIDINNIGNGTFGASAGTVTFTNANNTGLSNDSEVVYAYIGSASSPTFLAAISNVGFGTSDGTLTGTGLVAGQTAIGFTGGLDIMGYNGPRSGLASFADYLAAIGNTANWKTQNGSGNQSTDGTAPDAPFPTTVFTVAAPAAQTISFSPASVSVTEGNNGTKVLTFTVVRSGGTTGAISFSGSFAAGATDAADFGGTLPNPTFTGSIADGANSATITITISGDTVAEPDESFTLTLTGASNPSATVTIGTATATGTLLNDDGSIVSGNSSTPITLANDDHLTVLAGATLSASTPVTWIGGSTTPGALIDNLGTITGTNRAVYTSGSASGSFTINNEVGATITATKDAVKISNLVSGTSGTFTVNNDGTISSTGTGSDAGQALDLDDVNSSGVNTVINNAATGVISAAGEAISIVGAFDDSITNTGSIFGSIALDGGDDTLVNGGTIIGDAMMGEGDDSITNTGSIFGNIMLDGGDDTLVNCGTIIGEAMTGEGDDSITNTGSIFGNIMLDGGDDTLITGGIITGDAMMGEGDDSIDILTGSVVTGTIDGGAGIDTLELSGSGFGSLLGTVVDVEKLDIRSGVWRVEDAAGYTEITVESGAGVALEGTATGMVVSAGASLWVYGSDTDSVVSGNQYIQSGGSAHGTTVAAGGEQDIRGGGLAGQTTIDGGTQTVFGVATDTTIANGGIQHVHNNVFSTIVNDGGDQNVYAEGSATGTTINAGGVQIDWGFTITTTISGGYQFVFGSASLTTINSGVQTVQGGGTASDTTIHSGEQNVYSGGNAINTTMDGGSQAVYGGATQTIIGNGAIQYLHGTASLTTVNAGGKQSVYADGFATGTTINAGGYQLDWGTASGTVVNGGVQYVYGSAIGTTVLAGVQHVQSGGSADDTTIGAGALTFVHAGGTIDDVVFGGPDAALVLAQASSFTGTISGWQDYDSIALADILFNDGVTSLSYAANDDNSGGTLTVSDGTQTATLSLLGQYSAADFALSSDGHGGTLISDPGVVQQSQLAPALHG